MYKIILQTWYQEKPNEIFEEQYEDLEFDDIYDAAEYLGKNIEKIAEWYPVCGDITIKYYGGKTDRK